MAKEKINRLDLLEPILVTTLGLKRVYRDTPLMKEWLSATGELNGSDLAILTESQDKLIENVDSWNEEELKMNFISFIIFLARFDKSIRTYYDREMSAEIGEHTLLCKADMLLASGVGELIQTPYFFLHEYKREKKYSGDPVGQMLGGMLIGQAKNKNGNRNADRPMYGCYVQGRFWFFSILEGSQYVISRSFDSSDPLVAQQIIMILRRMKDIIHNDLM